MLGAAAAAAQPVAGSITMRQAPGRVIVTDAAGNLYAAANAESFKATPGAAQPQPGGGDCVIIGVPFGGTIHQPCLDIFILKQDASGKTVFGTYLGGPTNDATSAIAVNAAGEVYVAGMTGGSFPVTSRAALTSITGNGNFAAKLSADGTKFLYATYLPSTIKSVAAIAVDDAGNLYATGDSTTGHVVALKVNADGSAFVYSRELAGSRNEVGKRIAVDGSGNAVIAGTTLSADFPVTSGAAQTTLRGSQNGFAAKLNASGDVVFATFLGGSGADAVNAVQLDAAGNVYLGGSTTSIDFPNPPGSFHPAPVAYVDQAPTGFLTKLSARGDALAWSTYIASFGGIRGLAVNSAGEVYAEGDSLDQWPAKASSPRPCWGKMFVTHLDAQGRYVEATYLDASTEQVFPWMKISASGTITLNALPDAGPVLATVTFGGAGWKADACLSVPGPVNGASYLGTSKVTPGEYVTFFGFGIGPDTGVANADAPTSLGGVQVFFDGIPAPVIYAVSTQVNAIAPQQLSGRSQTIMSLVYNGVRFGPYAIPVSPAGPEFFRIDPRISTQAPALNEDGSINNADHPARRGSIVAIFGTGFGVTSTTCATGGLNPAGQTSFAPNEVSVVARNGARPMVTYAGGAPTLQCGVAQVNFVVPPDTAPGDYLVAPVVKLADGRTVAGQVYVSVAVR
jgi:uncharacterized protein (TIGR03437 family)